jgi:hypothetical protein
MTSINFTPAPGSRALSEIPAGGPVHILPDIPPFALTSDVSAEDFVSTMAPLGTRHENPCLPVRWLSTGEGIGVIQFCELEHHTDNLAHRMTNPDGSVTTWRN